MSNQVAAAARDRDYPLRTTFTEPLPVVACRRPSMDDTPREAQEKWSRVGQGFAHRERKSFA